MADVVLTEDARYNDVLAAREGETVPQELADAHGWAYARKGTKAAQKAVEDSTSE